MNVVMVTGGRDWMTREPIQDALFREFHPGEQNILLVGDCPTGADALATDVAESELGFRVYRHHAAWKQHGKAAGPMRNQRMVDQKPRICLAFPTRPRGTKGSGTWDAVARAEKAGIPVRVIAASPTDPAVLAYEQEMWEAE